MTSPCISPPTRPPTETSSASLPATSTSAGTIQATGGWDKFTIVQLGKIKVPEGVKTITVKPTKTFGTGDEPPLDQADKGRRLVWMNPAGWVAGTGRSLVDESPGS